MFKFIILIIISLSTITDDKLSYINRYKEIAIIEMKRTGIPASIKLAQGILETAGGTGTLAIEANNHFGIKCKNYWKGDTYYHKDDDLDEKGDLIKSCFRSYQNPIDSYVDHSNFIKHNITYSTLINSGNIDYKYWARGLQYYGYASDPAYADKLISLIERYNLDTFDN